MRSACNQRQTVLAAMPTTMPRRIRVAASSVQRQRARGTLACVGRLQSSAVVWARTSGKKRGGARCGGHPQGSGSQASVCATGAPSAGMRRCVPPPAHPTSRGDQHRPLAHERVVPRHGAASVRGPEPGGSDTRFPKGQPYTFFCERAWGTSCWMERMIATFIHAQRGCVNFGNHLCICNVVLRKR